MVNRKRGQAFHSPTACDIVWTERPIPKFEVLFLYVVRTLSALPSFPSHSSQRGFSSPWQKPGIRRIYSLAHAKSFQWLYFFPFSRNSAGASEHKCVLTGRRVHIYTGGRNAQINFWGRPWVDTWIGRKTQTLTAAVGALSFDISYKQVCSFEEICQAHMWTKSREFAFLCNRHPQYPLYHREIVNLEFMQRESNPTHDC